MDRNHTRADADADGDAPGIPASASPVPVVGVDPKDFLRALLRISPEDAASAREDAAKAGERQEPAPR